MKSGGGQDISIRSPAPDHERRRLREKASASSSRSKAMEPVVTQYLFKVAQQYQPAFAHVRRSFSDDAAALRYVPTLAACYPFAATITVVVEARTVDRVTVNCAAADDATANALCASRKLIARAQSLLAELNVQSSPAQAWPRADPD